jgi:hypothetical protein
MSREKVPFGATTGIGSLPHHNIDAALEYAFRFEIPFLPQIPMRNPWEFSLPQGLDGIPGIRVESDGSVLLDTGVWVGRAKDFDDKLSHAFDQASQASAFEAFEPSAATSSSWQPFLWELQERGTRVAKIQTVGPLTAQWSLRSTDNERLDQHPDISRQIFRLVLARALGMARRLLSIGVTPVLYLDEPALFIFSSENPAHLLGLQQLKVLVQTLQKEGVAVGLHCCSNTKWEALGQLGLDFLSFDTRLSLASLLDSQAWVAQFIAQGGRLSLGIVPTTDGGEAITSLRGRVLQSEVSSAMEEALGPVAQTALNQALWTPACGLALHTPRDAEHVLSVLLDARQGAARLH